jgi:hypothetical protein
MSSVFREFWPEFGPVSVAKLLQRRGVAGLLAHVERGGSDRDNQAPRWNALFRAVRDRLTQDDLESLVNRLAPSDERGRAVATVLLGWTKPEYLSKNVRLLKTIASHAETSGLIAGLFVVPFLDIPESEVIDVLLHVIETRPHSAAEWQAAVHLSDLGVQRSIPILQEYASLQEPNARMVARSNLALARLGVAEAVPRMVEAAAKGRREGSPVFCNTMLGIFIREFIRDQRGEALPEELIRSLSRGDLSRTRKILGGPMQWKADLEEWWLAEPLPKAFRRPEHRGEAPVTDGE